MAGCDLFLCIDFFLVLCSVSLALYSAGQVFLLRNVPCRSLVSVSSLFVLVPHIWGIHIRHKQQIKIIILSIFFLHTS
jgi:hypothetical protein